MRAKEMRERADEDLAKMMDEAKGELFKLKLNNATHQLDNTGGIRQNRREIARIKTILREREISVGVEAPGTGENEE